MTLRIVTDSTADLQPEWVEALNIHVIPLSVRLQDKEIRDGDMSHADLYAYLQSDAPLPQTSQITPAEFVEAYNTLIHEGATEIISIHLSFDLSGTVNSARLAAEQVSVPVHVIDARQATMGLALIVRAVAERAQEGATCESLLALAQDMAQRTKIYFLLNDLSTLEKGGRIGKAAYLLGSVLSVKPILMLHDGVISVYDKVRTRKTERAIERLAAIYREETKDGLTWRIFGYNDMPVYADVLTEALDGKKEEELFCELGCVVSSHIGLGAVGVAFYQPERKNFDEL